MTELDMKKNKVNVDKKERRRASRNRRREGGFVVGGFIQSNGSLTRQSLQQTA